MQFSLLAGLLVTLTSLPSGLGVSVDEHPPKITPQVFIISMFTPESQIWHNIPDFNLLSQNITLPGLSPLFPYIHCTADQKICQLTTGEGEINAAVSTSALVLSPLFNLSKTYFLIAGIAGINPEIGTISSVTFARFAVQVALQYEIDAREIPRNMSTGYIPQGSVAPGQYPGSVYGTEVFEVNDALRKIAARFARNATLADSDVARDYRSRYISSPGEEEEEEEEGIYGAATKPPSVIECDTATSDVYFSGKLLGDAFSNTTKVLTENQGVYCTTQQEDNATLEALLRGASSGGLVDFGRIIIMRTASDFDRPYPGQSAMDNLLYAEQGAFEPAVENLYRAGIQVVMGILRGWEGGFEGGVRAGNYLGDDLETLGGKNERRGQEKLGKRGVRAGEKRGRR
ncbi:purine nucleoside permease [Aspergillus cavernicola]|uniref:Purine nucleoside permease n=1 Tax=Aspergillus cavernicola TaxID=176166 RepID=A0ABR4I7Z2_9EURO